MSTNVILRIQYNILSAIFLENTGAQHSTCYKYNLHGSGSCLHAESFNNGFICIQLVVIKPTLCSLACNYKKQTWQNVNRDRSKITFYVITGTGTILMKKNTSWFQNTLPDTYFAIKMLWCCCYISVYRFMLCMWLYS